MTGHQAGKYRYAGRVIAGLGVLVATGLAAAGCGSDLGGGLQPNTVTAYEAASAFSSTGHHVADLGGGRYRVTATGSAATPKARVEKIAMARAAEFGVENNGKYFQPAAPQFSIRCGKREYLEKGEKKTLPVRGYTVVQVDVAYSNTQTDPSYRAAKDVSETLKAELQGEQVADEARQAATAEVTAQCGA
ncbi:MAG: hypothetical protein IKE66_02340 [Hyphomicrobium sp.]|nr:hypothetical protein [Hyphomicrobium sp.]